MRFFGRILGVVLLVLAAGVPGAGAACNGPCDVVVELDVSPRNPSDGALLTYTLKYCDTTGSGAVVDNAFINLVSASWDLATPQWTSCTATTCSYDPAAGPMYGSLTHDGFALAANQCVTFTFTARLTSGLGGQNVCLQAQTFPQSNCSKFSCATGRRSDDPTTTTPPAGNFGDSTCVPVPGCAMTVSVTPALLNTCVGSGETLTGTVTGCSSGLTYQWTKNGTDIPGATASTYTIPVSEPPDGYRYRLRATCTALGCSKVSNLVQVNLLTTSAELMAPSSACAGQTVQVFVQSGVSCSIKCTAASPPVNACSTNCTYPTVGSFVISATASDGTCSGDLSQPINVITQPQACIDPLSNVCESSPGPTTTILGNCSTPGVDYQWTTTRGTFDDPAAPQPTLTFPLPPVTSRTAVTVTLQASSPSCGTPTTVQKSFDLLPSPVAQAMSSKTSACVGEDVNFTGQGSGTPGPFSYSWDFGDGGPGSSQQNPVHPFASAGTKTVDLTVTDTGFGCPATDTLSIDVKPSPLAIATLIDCNGNTAEFAGLPATGVSYLWAFGDGATSTQQNPTHTYATTSSYNVTLTVTDPASSCSSVKSLTVVIPCGVTCPSPVPAVVNLKSTKKPTLDDVTLTWDKLNDALEGYNVYSVDAKADIPDAGGPLPKAGVTGVCLAVPQSGSPICVSTGATPVPPEKTLYYNVRAVCGGTEGL